MNIDLYSQKGDKLKTISVSDIIFDADINEGLMHQALVRQQSNARVSLAHTLTKGETRGGGAKPFRQKGTGRARQGSVRNPHYKGGGVAMGPRTGRNFEKDMPKKQRRKALFSALSLKAKDGKVSALDKYESKEIKTKDFIQMLTKLPEARRTLIVLDQKNELIEKSAKNIPNVKVLLVNYLNMADLVKYEKVLFLEPALKKAEEIFVKNN